MDNYLKNLKIKNFKSYGNFNSGSGIDIATPDGSNLGSGMTILIGKNSSGKTSIGTIFTKLKAGARIYDEEKHFNQDTEFIFEDTNGRSFKIYNNPGGDTLIREDSGYTLAYDQVDIIKDNRVWNSGFSSGESYQYLNLKNEAEYKRSSVDNSTARRLAAIDLGEPEKKVELNAILSRIAPDFKNWEIKGNQKSGDYIAYTLEDGTKLDMDFSLGGGVLNMFRIALSLVENSDLIFIDEPEAFLHPTAQIELCKIFIEQSKDRQIIISSHSPYMFRDAIETAAKLYIFDKVSGETVLKDTRVLAHGLFGPSSPTWGEINYYAYDLPSVEFHNELFGFIQAKAILDSEDNGKEENFDTYLENRGILKSKTWIKINRDSTNTSFNRTLATYIRNSIHHPENRLNPGYTQDELRSSINALVTVLASLT